MAEKNKWAYTAPDAADEPCRCVVFDMDGVLFDSESLVLRCWEETAQKHVIPDIQEMCRACLGVNAIETRAKFLAHYGADFPYDAYKTEMSERYWHQVEQGALTLKPGVRTLLNLLYMADWRVGLCSSTRTAVIEEQLTLFGLRQCFHDIVGGNQLQRSKPDPEGYLLSCNHLGVLPEQAFAVEDSYNGVRAAASAGMRVIMIPDLLPPTPEMETLVEHIFPDMDAFRWFLEETEGLGRTNRLPNDSMIKEKS